MNKKAETRGGHPAEFREDEATGLVGVRGHAVVYDEWADIGGWFEERIAPGALDNVLGDDVVFLVNHEGLPLARNGSGTLKLSTDARGVIAETDLDPSDPDVARVIPKMRRGDLDKMSFAFRVAREEWDETGEIPKRTILEVSEFIDVSIVTHPAYGGTDIGLRSLEAHRTAAGNTRAATATRRMRMGLALTT